VIWAWVLEVHDCRGVLFPNPRIQHQWTLLGINKLYESGWSNQGHGLQIGLHSTDQMDVERQSQSETYMCRRETEEYTYIQRSLGIKSRRSEAVYQSMTLAWRVAGSSLYLLPTW